MHRFATALVLVALTLAAGCGTAAKTGLNQVRGSSGHLATVDNLQGSFLLDKYDTVLVGDFTDPNDMASSQTMTMLPGEIAAEIRKSEYFDDVKVISGAPSKTNNALLISGEILTVLQGGTFSVVIGQKPLMVADVTLSDAGTGERLGRAHCTGIALKIGDKEQMYGEGVGKAIMDWIEKHHTEPKD